MTVRHRLEVELGLLACLAFLWGSTYLFLKVAVTEIPPLTLIAARVSIAGVMLLVIVRAEGARLPRDARSWRLLFVQSIFNATVAWTLLAWGQQFVAASLASVLNSTGPIFVFLITGLVTRHERLGGRRLAGACLGLAGVTLIVGVDALSGLGTAVAGQLAVLFSAVLYGCAAIHGTRLSHLPASVSAAGTMIWASAVLIPASLVVDRPWTLAPSLEAVLATLVLGVFCTGLALRLYFRLVHTLGSMGVASQAYLRAGLGVALGTLLLGETVTATVGLGVAAAIAGVALINLPRRAPAAS